jgi:hypothetical protein
MTGQRPQTVAQAALIVVELACGCQAEECTQKGVLTMARYCGACGARLDVVALAGGRCRVCGAPVTDPREAISEASTQPLDGPLGLAPLEASAPAPVGSRAPACLSLSCYLPCWPRFCLRC